MKNPPVSFVQGGGRRREKRELRCSSSPAPRLDGHAACRGVNAAEWGGGAWGKGKDSGFEFSLGWSHTGFKWQAWRSLLLSATQSSGRIVSLVLRKKRGSDWLTVGNRCNIKHSVFCQSARLPSLEFCFLQAETRGTAMPPSCPADTTLPSSSPSTPSTHRAQNQVSCQRWPLPRDLCNWPTMAFLSILTHVHFYTVCKLRGV